MKWKLSAHDCDLLSNWYIDGDTIFCLYYTVVPGDMWTLQERDLCLISLNTYITNSGLINTDLPFRANISPEHLVSAVAKQVLSAWQHSDASIPSAWGKSRRWALRYHREEFNVRVKSNIYGDRKRCLIFDLVSRF